ncbi:gamma carbonic anhydrase family protein [Halovivax sp.]|uniref:gamma carbonic anhydrase family protein n=1 Tax=Halovivax sp. TaxID=1935978 RepID=UPI0025C107AD|nr:gamma carbonic anhydrase family protein [Halovivax sp.]
MDDRRSYEFEGVRPTIHADAHVSREATLIGDVTVAADASVWPGVVLRGDVEPIEVGRASHVGDNATIHGATIGERVMLGHGAVLNEATVGDGSLIGFNATVNTGVVVGAGSIVASGTVIGDNHEIPPVSFVRGVPAEVTPLAETGIDPEAIFEEYESGGYTDLAARHGELFE